MVASLTQSSQRKNYLHKRRRPGSPERFLRQTRPLPRRGVQSAKSWLRWFEKSKSLERLFSPDSTSESEVENSARQNWSSRRRACCGRSARGGKCLSLESELLASGPELECARSAGQVQTGARGMVTSTRISQPPQAPSPATIRATNVLTFARKCFARRRANSFAQTRKGRPAGRQSTPTTSRAIFADAEAAVVAIAAATGGEGAAAAAALAAEARASCATTLAHFALLTSALASSAPTVVVVVVVGAVSL